MPIQVAMVNDSHNEDLRSEELRCLIAYNKAVRDEELLLKQRAKLEWLSEGEKRNVDPILDLTTLFINKLSNDDPRFMVRPVLKEEIKEVLSLMIRRRIEEDGDFTFHLITAIEEFSGVSGLIPNLEKSSVFFSDVHDGLKESILEVLPFSTGILPMNLSSQWIGDGYTASIWFDNWLFLGPLSQYISKTDIFEAGLSLNCKKSNDGKVVHFSVKAAWSDVVLSKPVVPWYKLVWFSQNIPRHAFIFRLAINQHLKTQDRIASFKEMVRLQLAPNSLSEIVPYVYGRPLNMSIWSISQRLVIDTLVYFIWLERNLRHFQQKKITFSELVGLLGIM
ncbi:RNA-directed DNA polymerase, eukaryota, reverse transcriptase zinc-binding domain protein [Tanacetum coccineum]